MSIVAPPRGPRCDRRLRRPAALLLRRCRAVGPDHGSAGRRRCPGHRVHGSRPERAPGLRRDGRTGRRAARTSSSARDRSATPTPRTGSSPRERGSSSARHSTRMLPASAISGGFPICPGVRHRNRDRHGREERRRVRQGLPWRHPRPGIRPRDPGTAARGAGGRHRRRGRDGSERPRVDLRRRRRPRLRVGPRVEGVTSGSDPEPLDAHDGGPDPLGHARSPRAGPVDARAGQPSCRPLPGAPAHDHRHRHPHLREPDRRSMGRCAGRGHVRAPEPRP